VLSEPLLGGKLRVIAPDIEVRGEVKVTSGWSFGPHYKGPEYYDGFRFKTYTLDEIRGYLASDFVDLPF
jgi:hypothetical protein